MKTDEKEQVARRVDALIVNEIRRQSPEIVISEVVRTVFDCTQKLGIEIIPKARNDLEHHTRKHVCMRMLSDLYFKNGYSGVCSVVQTLLSLAREQHFRIVLK